MKHLWFKLPRWLRYLLATFVSLCMAIVLCVAAGWWYLHPAVDRTNGIVYGQRNGAPLTMDVLRPRDPNGRGIAIMVSGGWKSGGPGEFPVWLAASILRRGFTVFAICHVSQPESSVQEIIEDVNRGVRFVRHHAQDYGIASERIGVSGGSAGGHLSLMLATRGGPGDEDAQDPVDRESSEVQAVAIFYPPTDLMNLGDSTEHPGEQGGPPKSFRDSFGPDGITRWDQIGPECSPIFWVKPKLPPTLIYHGDADTLVPLDQSTRYQEAAQQHNNVVELVVHAKGGHGWWSMFLDMRHFARWFEEHLSE